MGLFKRSEVDKWDAWIGEKIREAREEANLTQAELGKMVYKSQGNISDYEAGRHRITAIDLMLIAHAVGKPADFFVPHPFYAPKNYADLSLKEQELIHYIQTIGGEDRENKVIELLLEQAKRLANLIIDTDVDAMKAEREASKKRK